MPKKLNHKKRGFTLLEAAVVLVIIGALAAGIFAGNKLIKKFKIAAAQNLTLSSPVQGITDSVLWLESSMDQSFNESESSNSSSLTAWYDLKNSAAKNNAIQSSSPNSPIYSNSINYIQAVKFDGTNSYLDVDGSGLNNTDYTIIILEQRDSDKNGNYFIGDVSSANDSITNRNLTLGYSADGNIRHSQSSDNVYTAAVSPYSDSLGKPRIFTFTHNKLTGKKIYVNGILAATSSDTNNLSNLSSIKIGKDCNGQIGEIVMFARNLEDEERKSIEDYLGKKWNSPILRSVAGGSCTNGMITLTGCTATCSIPSGTAGILSTSVSDGSGSLTCNTSNHFIGSLSYTCSNSILTFSGASSCACDSGYYLQSGSCVPNTC